MTSRLIVFIDLPLIEARLPTAPQPANAMMLFRTATRTVRGERTFNYAGTPPRYLLIAMQGFAIGDVGIGTYYEASVSRVVNSILVEMPAYAGRRCTKVTLHRSLQSPVHAPVDAPHRLLSQMVREASDDDITPPITPSTLSTPSQASSKRFDSNLIAADTLGRLLEYYSRAGSLLGWLDSPDATNDRSRRIAGLRWVASDIARGQLRGEIELLCRVANGELDRSKASKRRVAEVADSVDKVIGLLCEQPMMVAPALRVNAPKAFWRTDIGQVICATQKWLHGAHWIGYREAAQMLYGHDSRKAFNRINRLVDEGKLLRYEDPDEPNPQKAGRFDRREVVRLVSEMIDDK